MQESKVITIIVSVLAVMIIGAVALFIYAFVHIHHKKSSIIPDFINTNVVFRIPDQEHIISILDTHICSTCLLIVTGKHMIKSHIFIVDTNTGHIKSLIIAKN